jgi:hypothetical protein
MRPVRITPLRLSVRVLNATIHAQVQRKQKPIVFISHLHAHLGARVVIVTFLRSLPSRSRFDLHSGSKSAHLSRVLSFGMVLGAVVDTLV